MWAYESVFYQIYPIGFCGAPTENDGVTVPRIRKLMDWTDYLKIPWYKCRFTESNL